MTLCPTSHDPRTIILQINIDKTEFVTSCATMSVTCHSTTACIFTEKKVLDVGIKDVSVLSRLS